MPLKLRFARPLTGLLSLCWFMASSWSQVTPSGLQQAGSQRNAPPSGSSMPTQPAIIVQLPPNSPNGGVRAAPRPPEVAPVSPGQDTYSSTGAVPASSASTTYSSSGRVQSNTDCVRGGVVRKCN
jgi:hypothetical protein